MKHFTYEYVLNLRKLNVLVNKSEGKAYAKLSMEELIRSEHKEMAALAAHVFPSITFSCLRILHSRLIPTFTCSSLSHPLPTM